MPSQPGRPDHPDHSDLPGRPDQPGHPTGLGRLRVERLLGTGSFATVWLARDPDLDAFVAVKVLAENWAHDPGVRERFITEARLLRRLDDERVLRVHGVGETEGRPYAILAYADRGSLKDRLRQGPLALAEALGLLREIAAGVAVLHRAGVVHRDLTPGNVLFQSRPDGSTRVLVADLGLAKDLAVASGFTAAAGTPGYMAPEQADPLAIVDARADVYALGKLAAELGVTVEGATAHDPGDRPADAAAFAAALEPLAQRTAVPRQPAPQHMGSQPMSPRPVTQQPMTQQPVTQQPMSPQHMGSPPGVPQAGAPRPAGPHQTVPPAGARQGIVPQPVAPQHMGPPHMGPQSVVPQAAIPQPVAPQHAGPPHMGAQPVVPQAAIPQLVAPQPARRTSAGRSLVRRRGLLIAGAGAAALLAAAGGGTAWLLTRGGTASAGPLSVVVPEGWEAVTSTWAGHGDAPGILLSPAPDRWGEVGVPGAFVGFDTGLAATVPRDHVAAIGHNECGTPTTRVLGGWALAEYATCAKGPAPLVEAAAPGLIYAQVAPPTVGFTDAFLQGITIT
ncbi:serine/threonine-protein kinase [Actinorhabdospora filicis]|uniref:serine/threonine-protein kinase n=1 Tax=Actinorhabdospora filicis TaxID=1785913 RepID=UPI002556727E|nr:serine/threonine protein kinase [Actinorhabdospora filicis]